MPQLTLFYAFAALIALCSLMVVTSRNAVASAMFLVADLFALAGLYAMMEAHFIAAIQVLVYAGAIVVLFIFVIMLLNLAPETAKSKLRLPPLEAGVLLVTVIGFMAIGGLLFTGHPFGMTSEGAPDPLLSHGGNTYAVGMVLFTRYLWPFELASLMILLAIIASVLIAKKDNASSSRGGGAD